MTEVEVTRTYLEMTDPTQLRSGFRADPSIRLEWVKQCPLSFFRYLYSEVGRDYHWVDRLSWTDDEVQSYLAQPGLALWVIYREGAPAGYVELLKHEDGSVEIAYFGLLREYIGQGLGRHLLSFAVEQAWAMGANRVWLHTCSLDGPAALPNYLSRGFTPFKQETYRTTLSAQELALQEKLASQKASGTNNSISTARVDSDF